MSTRADECRLATAATASDAPRGDRLPVRRVTLLVWKVDDSNGHAVVRLEEGEEEQQQRHSPPEDTGTNQDADDCATTHDTHIVDASTATATAGTTGATTTATTCRTAASTESAGDAAAAAAATAMDPDNIPESVLRYERQIRKVQHERKVGRPLSIKDDLRVVYVDDHLVVVNKPPGVLTVPGIHGHANSIAQLVYTKYGKNGNSSVCGGGGDSPTSLEQDKGPNTDGGDEGPAAANNGSVVVQDTKDNDDSMGGGIDKLEHMIVHRLDMDTSGIVVFGRSLPVTKRLHEMFRDHTLNNSKEGDLPNNQSKKRRSRSRKRRNPGTQYPGSCQESKRDREHEDDGCCGRDDDVTASSMVQKEYEALVVGHFPSQVRSGLVHLPIQRDHEHPPFMRVSTLQSERDAARAVEQLRLHGWKKLIRKSPKPSTTEFHVLERGYRSQSTTEGRKKGLEDDAKGKESTDVIERLLPYTRLKLIPHTGRTHQLRVHCAALGYPIVGDPTYGLYGEANPLGGLLVQQQQQQQKEQSNEQHQQHEQQQQPKTTSVSRIIRIVTDNNNNKTTNNQSKRTSSYGDEVNDEHNGAKDRAKDGANSGRDGGGAVRDEMEQNACPLHVQEAWIRVHPPNIMPMCLHASHLSLQHPVTKKPLVFHVPPSF